MVLYLPSWEDGDLAALTISAIHSRSAEIVISRPMMTAASRAISGRGSLLYEQDERYGHHQLVGHGVRERRPAARSGRAPGQVPSRESVIPQPRTTGGRWVAHG